MNIKTNQYRNQASYTAAGERMSESSVDGETESEVWRKQRYGLHFYSGTAVLC